MSALLPTSSLSVRPRGSHQPTSCRGAHYLVQNSTRHASTAPFLRNISPSQALPRPPRGGAQAVGNGSACDPASSSDFGCMYTCADMMTSNRITVVNPDTPVDDALETIAANRITGMPVVERGTGKLVGVVSDFDLLSLDSVIGRSDGTGDIFPANGESWLAFRSVKKLLDKQAGKTVGDVMTPNPVVVHPETCLEDAARLLLLENIRRLPVLDSSGAIVGVISRSDIIQTALRIRRAKLN